MAFDFTGAYTLLAPAKYASDKLKKGVIQTLIQESPLLQMVPFAPFQGNALKVTVEGTLPTVQFRSVNETYARSTGEDTERMFGVTILGGEVHIDNFLLKVTADKVNLKAREFAKMAKAMARQFDKTFFDGTGTAKDFMGVNALIDAGLGLTHKLADGGGTISLDDLDVAQELMRVESPSAFLLNRTLRRYITKAAHTTHSGFSLIDVGTDVFGNLVNTYNGIPMRIIGDDSTGVSLLGFDESDAYAGGGNADTASIYLVKFGVEENLCGLAGAGGSLEVRDFGEQEAAPGHMGRVEWYPGLAVWDPYSIVRIRHINQIAPA